MDGKKNLEDFDEKIPAAENFDEMDELEDEDDDFVSPAEYFYEDMETA